MAYTIRYGSAPPQKRRRTIFLTLFFFLLFVLVANAFFSEYLTALREIVFPHELQDAVSAFCQALLTEAGTYEN